MRGCFSDGVSQNKKARQCGQRKGERCQDKNKKHRGNRVKQACLTPASCAVTFPLQSYTSLRGK